VVREGEESDERRKKDYLMCFKEKNLEKLHQSVYVGPSKIHKYGLFARQDFLNG